VGKKNAVEQTRGVGDGLRREEKRKGEQTRAKRDLVIVGEGIRSGEVYVFAKKKAGEERQI